MGPGDLPFLEGQCYEFQPVSFKTTLCTEISVVAHQLSWFFQLILYSIVKVLKVTYQFIVIIWSFQLIDLSRENGSLGFWTWPPLRWIWTSPGTRTQPVYGLPPSGRSKDPRAGDERIFVQLFLAELCEFPGPGVLGASLQCTEPGNGTMNGYCLPCHQRPNDTECWVFPRPTKMKCFCPPSTHQQGCHTALPSFGILFFHLLFLVYFKLLLFLNSSLVYE